MVSLRHRVHLISIKRSSNLMQNKKLHFFVSWSTAPSPRSRLRIPGMPNTISGGDTVFDASSLIRILAQLTNALLHELYCHQFQWLLQLCIELCHLLDLKVQACQEQISAHPETNLCRQIVFSLLWSLWCHLFCKSWSMVNVRIFVSATSFFVSFQEVLTETWSKQVRTLRHRLAYSLSSLLEKDTVELDP